VLEFRQISVGPLEFQGFVCFVVSDMIVFLQGLVDSRIYTVDDGASTVACLIQRYVSDFPSPNVPYAMAPHTEYLVPAANSQMTP
jgi:hypothetical protein